LFISVCFETDLFVSVVLKRIRNTEANRKINFWFRETNQKSTETDCVSVCFGSNRNFLFVCFEDTLQRSQWLRCAHHSGVNDSAVHGIVFAEKIDFVITVESLTALCMSQRCQWLRWNFLKFALLHSRVNDLSQIKSNWVKLSQIESNWVKLSQIESNWVKLSQIKSNWVTLDKIEPNWVKLSQIESNWVKLSQIESNWVKLSQIESNWVKLSQNESNCIGFRWIESK
jgi:hypothetical protein